MAVQGEFPKVDGDVLFAVSEVNRFASAPEFIGAGSSAELVSGTAFQDMGSLLIAGGSTLTNPFQIMTCSRIQVYGAGGAAMRLEISGTSTNSSVTVSNDLSFTNFTQTNTILGGSPFEGFLRGHGILNATDGGNTHSSTTFDNYDPTSEAWLFFKMKINTTSGTGTFAASYVRLETK